MLINDKYTGIENYIKHISDELMKQSEHDVRLILPSRGETGLIGNNVFRYDPPFQKYSRIIASFLADLKKLERFDVIHCPTVTAPFFFHPKSVKVVMTVHDLIPNLFPEWQPLRRRIYFKKFLRNRMKYVDHFIAVSEVTKKDIMDVFRIDEKKIDVITEGVSNDFFPRENHKKEGYILGLSTLEPRKNFKRLIDAFIRLKTRRHIKEKLIIIGQEGWSYQDILKIPDEFKNEIVFKGYLPKNAVIEMYQKAKVFVYPSYYEGFGLPVLEAMACGCPVITSNAASLPEVSGNAGILIDPYNTRALADAIYSVLDNYSMQCRMAKAGIHQAQKFNWEQSAKQTMHVYEKVLGKSL